jgi:hypothetical protein
MVEVDHLDHMYHRDLESYHRDLESLSLVEVETEAVDQYHPLGCLDYRV